MQVPQSLGAPLPLTDGRGLLREILDCWPYYKLFSPRGQRDGEENSHPRFITSWTSSPSPSNRLFSLPSSLPPRSYFIDPPSSPRPANRCQWTQPASGSIDFFLPPPLSPPLPADLPSMAGRSSMSDQNQPSQSIMSAYFDQTVQALSTVGGYMRLPALASTVCRMTSAATLQQLPL